MMKKFNLIKFVALLLAALIPAIALLLAGVLIPAQYKLTFLGALAPKYQRLNAIEEPKVILVGGSSTAFGLDSALLEESVGMPVVNFGLYATLGTKLMLDLSRDGIGEGDIVVLAPEIDAQTLSLYFNAESTWQAAEADPSMLLHVGGDNWGELLAGYTGYLGDKFDFYRGGTPDPTGVYNSRNFNEYGDIQYERPYNTMLLGYDPNMIISLDADIVEDDFIDYVNTYIADAEAKGAKVYFSFPPMNEDALAPDTTEESIYAFYDYLARSLDCQVISNPNDYIYPQGYFYDTNFHLNESGIILRTAALAADLRRVMGNTEILSIELPAVPEKPVEEKPILPEEIPDTSAYFLYSDIAGGLMITGLTAEAQKMESISIPAEANGKTVVAIGANAFAGCSALKEVTIYPNIVQFFDGCFRGASSLTRIIMYHQEANEKVAVGEQLFDGLPANATLYYTTQAAFTNFASDYYWGAYYSNRMDILQ
ncbi:MAG: hypothetical protein E7654_03050 [Ruminococcaceae bacterium]|nr:hypothetical protein [Oscillospiraceae bacterium]